MTHPTNTEVAIDDRPGVRLVEVHGALDVFSASGVGARILAGLPPETTRLVVDLDHVEIMDSAGVSALVRLREHARFPDIEVHVRLGSAPHLSATVVALLRRVLIVDDVIDLSVDDDHPVVRSPVGSTG